MSDINIDDFYTNRHKKLITLATWANVFSWIVLVVSVIIIFGKIMERITVTGNIIINNNHTSFLETMIHYPGIFISYIVEWIYTAVNGLVYFFVLRGISLGLTMIVETDLNYREKTLETDHAE